MTYCASFRRHRERDSFKERKRILVLSLFIILSISAAAAGLKTASASSLSITGDDAEDLIQLTNEQNATLLSLAKLFVMEEGSEETGGATSLMYDLMNENNAIGKIGKNITTAVGMILILVAAAIQLIQLAEREDESLDSLMRVLLVCIVGFFMITYVDDILSAIEKLGYLLYSGISKGVDDVLKGETGSVTAKEVAETVGNAISADGFALDPAISTGAGVVAEEDTDAIRSLGSIIDKGVVSFMGSILMTLTFYSLLAAAYGLVFEFVIRKIFAPIAMADFVTQGARSPGVRYLKNYFGMYIRIGVFCIVILLGIFASVWVAKTPKAERGSGVFAAIYCIRFAMRGLISASGQLTKEIMGS